MNSYMLPAICVAILSIVPFFIKFQHKKHSSREVVIMAVMIALCIASRMIFAFVPHFKPVTALIIITGMYFGKECGFITGSLTALLSNFYYGQGPWTVFQMLSWGLIGILSGILNLKNKALLKVYSALCGIIFSLIMDLYTVLSIDSNFSAARYISYVISSLPVMIEYVISNIVFILALEKPIGKKLERVKLKYGIFN